MYSIFPSAYPQHHHHSYYPDDYGDYFQALAEQRARARREAHHRAQLEARRRQAYQERLAAAKRHTPFLGEFDDSDPHSSFLHGDGGRSPRRYENDLEDLVQQQMSARTGRVRHSEQPCRVPVKTPEPSPSNAVPAKEPIVPKINYPPSRTPVARDAAARKIQAFVRAQAPRARAFKTIGDIARQFEDTKAAFQFPAMLDFTMAPSDPDAAADVEWIPTLLFTPRNAPLHGYEHALVKLLSKLDAVDSHGDTRIRRVRKQLVKSIEGELSVLDAKKTEIWREKVCGMRDTAVGALPSPRVVHRERILGDPPVYTNPTKELCSMDSDGPSSPSPSAQRLGEDRENAIDTSTADSSRMEGSSSSRFSEEEEDENAVETAVMAEEGSDDSTAMDADEPSFPGSSQVVYGNAVNVTTTAGVEGEGAAPTDQEFERQ